MHTDQYGTLPGRHYRKYCQNSRKGCQFVQYYGYHINGSEKLIYDDDWSCNPYFLSSHQTAFSITFLKKFNIEILIGQLTYLQKSEIYNYTNGYNYKTRITANEEQRFVAVCTQQHKSTQSRFAYKIITYERLSQLCDTALVL